MDPTGLLYYKINNASVKLDTILRKLLTRFSLTPSQFIFLSVLEKYQEATSKMIGLTLAVDPSTLTPLIKRLSKAGFIKKTTSSDKRSYLLAMSEKGKTAYQNALSVLSEFEDRLNNELSPDEKQLFDSTLLKIDRFIFKIQKQLLY